MVKTGLNSDAKITINSLEALSLAYLKTINRND